MIAVHLDNLLFLLLVAVAVLFQLLAKAASKTRKDQTRRTSTPIPRTPSPIPRGPRASDEEQIRKLLEALGHPPTSRPPPPVVARTDIPLRPLAPVQPPVLQPTSPWILHREERRKREVIPKEGAPSPTVARVEKITPPKITGAPAFEVQEGPLPIELPPTIKAPAEAYAVATRTIAKTDEARSDMATLLGSKSGLRAAMILREILGPPRGLRALDLL
jgi:hypothetical protein